MMDKEPKDNLEQFFQKNLENYSPVPDEDFWARLEPAIPVKPPFWSVWGATIGKVLGGLGTIGLLVFAVNYWVSEQAKVKSLTAIVKEQQAIIESLERNTAQDELNQTISTAVVEEEGTTLIKEASILNSKAQINRTTSTQSEIATNEKTSLKQAGISETVNQAKESIGLEKSTSSINVPQLSDANVAGGRQDIETPFLQEAGAPGAKTVKPANTAQEEKMKTIEKTKNLQKIALSNLTPLSFELLHQGNTPSLKTKINKGLKPYPRFSLEGGTSAFIMPMNRLFLEDAGSNSLSLKSGVLVNFEMNSSWMLQTGFNFTNIRSSNYTFNYNSFPFSVKKRYRWGENKYLELKSGVELNTLINTQVPDQVALSELGTSFVNLIVGSGAAIPINEKINLLVEPFALYSLTPVSNNKRVLTGGIYVGARYTL